MTLHTAIVVGIGANMRQEHESGLVEQAFRRVAEFGLECDADKMAPLVVYGDQALVLPSADLHIAQYRLGQDLCDHWDLGQGANLLAGVHGALSSMRPDDQLLIMAITDCDGIAGTFLGRIHQLMAITPQAFLLVVHTSTNANGMMAAKAFGTSSVVASPSKPNIAMVLYTDAKGNNVGENLTAHARPLIAQWRSSWA